MARFSWTANCLVPHIMSRIVLWAGQAVEHHVVEELTRQFGWSLNQVSTLRALAQVAPADVAAVIFAPATLEIPWQQALRSVRELFPDSLAVVSQGFAE